MTYKIGLDFHGVISAEPHCFAIFCHEIRKLGVEVYIISGGPKADIVKYLDKCGIEYDHVWAILDTCAAQGTVAFFEDGSFKVPTDIWDKAKALYCAKEGIDFHIDDSQIYGQYFVTPYCRYQIGEGCCQLDGKMTVDFHKPVEAAQRVAHFLKGMVKKL